MNREIKFRAWDNNSKIFVKEGNILIKGNGRFEVVDECNDFAIAYNGDHIGSEFCLMQYTGLKDKNGKGIYEGDIYEHSDGLVIVVWTSTHSCFEAVFANNETATIPVWEINFLNLPYMGNIYENEELLK